MHRRASQHRSGMVATPSLHSGDTVSYQARHDYIRTTPFFKMTSLNTPSLSDTVSTPWVHGGDTALSVLFCSVYIFSLRTEVPITEKGWDGRPRWQGAGHPHLSGSGRSAVDGRRRGGDPPPLSPQTLPRVPHPSESLCICM